jgi:hypothetical protein
MVLSFQGDSHNKRLALLNSHDCIHLPFENEMISLFSVLEQLLEKLKLSSSPLQALVVVENIQEIVQTNVSFADRFCASELEKVEQRDLLESLSRFFSSLGPLKQSLLPGVWYSVLNLDPTRARLKSPWIRDGFLLAISQGTEIVQSFFQMYSERFAAVRPDRKWLEIAASYWVELSQLSERISKSLVS